MACSPAAVLILRSNLAGMSDGRIDVHSHFLPDFYREAATAAGHAQPDGIAELPVWTAAGHVAMMDRLGIATSLLSVSSPGVHFGDDGAARDLARQVNEEGHRATEAHPGRFGLFAALPAPDVDGSIAEIRYCYDHLGVDGVALLTNAGGTYLGDPALEPVFDELDRHRARVFVHPTSPACWESTSFGRPRPMIEFLLDTTRAVVNLVLNGTIARHPGIEFVIAHAGAALPVVADRVAAFTMLLTDVDGEADVIPDLARLHYDLAGFPVPRQLDAILALTTLEHLHYGSDYPFTPEFVVEMGAQALASAGDPAGSVASALAGNTRRLFPARGTISPA
jgi:predicted TIM-barrel fold metal-dependent hydrolase